MKSKITTVEDDALDVIAEVIRRTPAKAHATRRIKTHHHRPSATAPSEHHLQLGNEARVVVKACKAKTACDVADAIDVAATKGDHAL